MSPVDSQVLRERSGSSEKHLLLGSRCGSGER